MHTWDCIDNIYIPLRWRFLSMEGLCFQDFLEILIHLEEMFLGFTWMVSSIFEWVKRQKRLTFRDRSVLFWSSIICLWLTNYYSINPLVLDDSEGYASELLERIEETLHRYYTHTYIYNMFKYSTTQYYVAVYKEF